MVSDGSTAGDLHRRRQRLLSFQLSHTPPSTPSKLEPEQSSLESGSTGGHYGSWRLDPSTSFDSGHRSNLQDSNQNNPHLLFASSPQSWWPFPGSLSPPSLAPPPAPAWLPNSMAPPSPAYCDGCQRWGNLLSVTVSQTRAH